MLDLDVRRLLVETATDLHHTGRARDRANLGTRVLDVVDFLLEQRHRDLDVLDAEGARHAAAVVGVLHLDEVDARRCLQKRARLLVDAETAADVARIVVRDLLSTGRRRH